MNDLADGLARAIIKLARLTAPFCRLRTSFGGPTTLWVSWRRATYEPFRPRHEHGSPVGLRPDLSKGQSDGLDQVELDFSLSRCVHNLLNRPVVGFVLGQAKNAGGNGVAARNPEVACDNHRFSLAIRLCALLDEFSDRLGGVSALVHEVASIQEQPRPLTERIVGSRAKSFSDPPDHESSFPSGTTTSVKLRRYQPGRRSPSGGASSPTSRRMKWSTSLKPASARR